MTPALGASAVLVIFLIFFREPPNEANVVMAEPRGGFEVVGAESQKTPVV
jgi:hypothetical protein